MVCYARPASLLAAIVAIAWLGFSGPVSHFFSTAAVMVAVMVATAAAAAGAALVFAAFMSTRRRRARAGGCVSCRFQCQHAMTGHAEGRLLWLVTTADRRELAEPGQGVTGCQSPLPARSAPVLLPMPEVRDPGPRWPDRPLYRVPPGTAPQRERAGSPA
jgi:predicted small integral membrane protein